VLSEDVIAAPEFATRPLQPPHQPPPPLFPHRPKRSPRRLIVYGVTALLAALLVWLVVTAPLSKSLEPIAAPAITLLSAEGKPIARRGAVTDMPVDVVELPEHVTDAFVSVEDRRFFRHLGIDPWGMARAAVRNASAGGVRQGGSTITQQLAKLAFLSSDRTAGRKIQEVFISLWLEAWLSKEEILSRYLSSVYFGDNVYGLRAASQHYFSRDPEDLSVAQAAMLAGVVQAPSRLAPTRHLSAARARAKIVVATMVDTEALSEAEARALKPAKLKVRRVEELPTGTYFADWVFPQARRVSEASYGEKTIDTTLEDDLQRLASSVIRRTALGGAQVALVAMRPDGRVVAMVGGKNYKQSSFNRATQARRQPGSTFKLFVYLAALREGMDLDSMVEDEPLTIAGWSPKNHDGNYRGLISLREAFARSSNVAAVRLSERIGRDKVIRAARDLGIQAPLTDDASIALGTSGVSLLEMTAAYAAVAGNRFPVRPTGLPAEEEGWFSALRGKFRQFSERSTRPKLLELLHAAVDDGTGRAAKLRIPTYGKTGTTQDYRDAFFIGFAGDLVTGVWVGKDDNTPLKGVTGGGLPARIWRDFMGQAVGGAARAPVIAPVPRVVVRPDPQEPGATLSVPIEGTGYDVGLEVGEDGVRISTQPTPDRAPPPVTIEPAGPPPLPREDEPVDEGE
jgi:penicillin-binding protein 1A